MKTTPKISFPEDENSRPPEIKYCAYTLLLFSKEDWYSCVLGCYFDIMEDLS